MFTACLSSIGTSLMSFFAASGSGDPGDLGRAPECLVSLENCWFTFGDDYLKFDTADVMTNAECADLGGSWMVSGAAPDCVTGACCLSARRNSRENWLDDFAVNIGESEISPLMSIGQAGVVDT